MLGAQGVAGGWHALPPPPPTPSPPRIHRVGFNENLVRKGLLYLQSNGDFEYRRERRLVHRMR